MEMGVQAQFNNSRKMGTVLENQNMGRGEPKFFSSP